MRRGFLLDAGSRKPKPLSSSNTASTDAPKPVPIADIQPEASGSQRSVVIPAAYIHPPDNFLTHDEISHNFACRAAGGELVKVTFAKVPARPSFAFDPVAVVVRFNESVCDQLISRSVCPLKLDATAGFQFEVKDAPGAGKGLFATASFARGARIACERPMFVMPAMVPFFGERVIPRGLQLIEAALQPHDAQFFALHNCKSAAARRQGHPGHQLDGHRRAAGPPRVPQRSLCDAVAHQPQVRRARPPGAAHRSPCAVQLLPQCVLPL
ncbi:hypothetical protein BV25DRAFT_1826534 [Artomyces pyxidatus]|uniref:Uncharacterized protein n=1 Tax=Artomyces pyxidatus TaxID=48021 RepID=A0ACB8SZ11_9AGAM|nr:hypothetical protein BV25DRAFT_1826534 [Artomyces pyxidatus]